MRRGIEGWCQERPARRDRVLGNDAVLGEQRSQGGREGDRLERALVQLGLDLAHRNPDPRGRTELVGEAVQGRDGVFLRPREHVGLGVGRGKQTRFPRISEESGGGPGADEHDMADTVQFPHCEVHRVGDAIDRNPPPAAGHARDLGWMSSAWRHSRARTFAPPRGPLRPTPGPTPREPRVRASEAPARRCESCPALRSSVRGRAAGRQPCRRRSTPCRRAGSGWRSGRAGSSPPAPRRPHRRRCVPASRCFAPSATRSGRAPRCRR